MIAQDCIPVSVRMIFICSYKNRITSAVLKHVVKKRDFYIVYLET